jgi:mannitol/fructose-specific phosphotransferase system IIA component (Ntr-type)
MKLNTYLQPDSILLNVQAEDKKTLLKTMCDCISTSPAAVESGLDNKTIYKAIKKREEQSSTGIGSGFAFPHARFPDIKGIGICLAVLDKPLDYNSFDGQDINLACMVIVPEKKPTLALKVMAQIARIFSDNEFHQKVKEIQSVNELAKIIAEHNINLDITIAASDIMRPPLLTLSPDTPLKEAARQMAACNVTATAVVDKDKRIIGEISTTHLFLLGIPDFFTQLKSVAFMSEFDPFEKYFAEESKSETRDLMDSDFCSLGPDASIMEMVFALIVKKYPKIYIALDGILIGVVDQPLVLERIINI